MIGEKNYQVCDPDTKMRKLRKNSYKRVLLFSLSLSVSVPAPPPPKWCCVGLRVKVNIVGFQSVYCTMAVNYNLLRNAALCSASCASLITFHPAKTSNCALPIRFTATHHHASSVRKRKHRRGRTMLQFHFICTISFTSLISSGCHVCVLL